MSSSEHRAYMREYMKTWRAKKIAEDAEGFRSKQRAWAKKYRKERLLRDPAEVKRQWSDASRKYKYGVTRAQYDALRERAHFRCEICKRHEDDMPKSNRYAGISLHLDHDHRANRVRGVLCFHCNAMLGHAQDSIEMLQKAIEYLRTHS